MTPDEIKRHCTRHPERRAMVIMPARDEQGQKDRILHFGRWDRM